MEPVSLSLKAIGLLKKWWKPLLGAGTAIALVVGGVAYRDHLIASGDAQGFARAEAQYKAAVDATNKVAASDQKSLDLMGVAFNGLASQRAQAIDLKVTPQIQKVQDEVAADPRYRDCAASDSVLDSLQAVRAAVDAGISSSNPGRR